MTTESVVAAPPEPLRPTTVSERIETIDILRGMALFGILAANIRGFAGPALTYFFPHLFWPALHDRIAQALIDTFIQQKFITIFAFLFGAGFAVQFERATRRNAAFGWRFLWRMTLLLAIGVAHGLLIWFGDILLVYALCGVMLIPFRKRQDKTLTIWAVILLLIVPLIFTLAFLAAQAGAQMPDPTPKAADIVRDANTYENGSFAEITARRAADAVLHNWALLPVFGWQVLGLFLLGMLAWRRGFFQPATESLPRYRRWMWIGLAVGLTGNAAATAYRWLADPPALPTDVASYAFVVIQQVATPFLSLGYICFVVLLCQSEAMRARLHRFAAIGRTALTNYLLQSVIGTLLFYNYGLGFFGDAGPALLLPLTFVIFLGQLYLSAWWVARYRFGPVEWVWRKLTYGGTLPMRREAASMPQAAFVAAPPE